MKIIFFLLLALVCMLAYYGFSFYQKFSVAQKLIASAEPFKYKSAEDGASMLVLGDSTAVGVGADSPKDSVPGRLQETLKLARVENKAVSGARVSDIEEQTRGVEDAYDYVLVMVGANDLIRFADAEATANTLWEGLEGRFEESKLIIVLSAGNLGGAKIFPWFVRPFHTRLNHRYHAEFERVANELGATYINLYEDPTYDPFIREPQVYLAPDGLHPSSRGYEIWGIKVLEQANLMSVTP